MPQASRLFNPNCFFKSSLPRSASKYQAGISFRAVSAAAPCTVSLSSAGTRISEGVMRASSVARFCGAMLAAQKRPLVSVSHTSPRLAVGDRPILATASSTESDFSDKSALSVSVPGVTIRTILRSIVALPGSLGSPICSQIATETPSFTRRARYCSSVAAGIPAIGMGLP